MFSRKENNSVDQTEFVEEGGFIEGKPHQKFSFKDFKNNKSLLPFYILAALLLLFFSLAIIKNLSSKQSSEVEQLKQNQESVELDPLTLRVNELREQLKEHDPTKQSLPFPQVDLKFNID